MGVAIWWIRRDLRLTDNPALSAALSSAQQVIPVFIQDPFFDRSPMVSSRRLAFLADGLSKLDEELRLRGSYLVIRRGQPLDVLSDLVDQTGAERIFAEADYSPYARRRDRSLEDRLDFQLVGGPSLSHPRAVLKQDGSPYTVYSPYMRAWKATHLTGQVNLTDPPSKITTPPGISSDPARGNPDAAVEMDFVGGEQEAQRRLEAFTHGESQAIYRYAELRDRMDLDATSRLSPYLRFGMLSAGQAVQAAQGALQNAPDRNARKGAETWLNELIWREFYIAILYHFPEVSRVSFRENLRDIRWNNDPREFEAWGEGRTGYPVVDAAMRQLRNTGWMHNRARMIVASFLTKDLLIDWRWGERWFMQQLIDGDPAANNGGWQWTAGTGTDAAPYFRIFNPVLQSKKFDPGGDYIRRWVPELVRVPERYIHTPWEMPIDQQRSANCLLGEHYPLPIVDHSFARQRTLAAYKNAGQAVD